MLHYHYQHSNIHNITIHPTDIVTIDQNDRNNREFTIQILSNSDNNNQRLSISLDIESLIYLKEKLIRQHRKQLFKTYQRNQKIAQEEMKKWKPKI